MQERSYPEPEPKEKSLVDIRTLLRQLQQEIESAEWNGEPCDNIRFEYDHVKNYHMQTGSNYYPLF